MGISFGQIRALIPLERGEIGRIIRLPIEGTECGLVLGQELETRRALNPSHLYSSACAVSLGNPDENELPQSFTLLGAG